MQRKHAILLLLIVVSVLTMFHLATMSASQSSSHYHHSAGDTRIVNQVNAKKRLASSSRLRGDDDDSTTTGHGDDDDADQHLRQENDHDTDGGNDKTAAGDCHSLPLHYNATRVAKVQSVQLCWSEEQCSGKLVVKMMKAECDDSAINSADAPSSRRQLTANSKLKREFLVAGPHLFRLRLDGPEVHVVPQSRVDYKQCQYEFLFVNRRRPQTVVVQQQQQRMMPAQPVIGTGGDYRIGLELLYRNFAHVDESRDVWPELLKQPILKVEDDFSTRYHLQQCTLPSQHVIRCQLPHSEASQRTFLLPKCTGMELDTSGRWKRTTTATSSPSSYKSYKQKVWTRVRVKKIRKEPILFEWASQPEPEARWIPNACSLPSSTGGGGIVTKSVEERTRRMFFEKYGGKRIAVSGDSQLRALYYAFVNTLNGNGDKCVRNMTTVLSEPPGCVANVKGSQRKSIVFRPTMADADGDDHGGGDGEKIKDDDDVKISNNAVQLDYIDDLFLNRIKHKLKGYDVVVAGFGQHPASREHWKYERYAGAVVGRINDLKKVSSSLGDGGANTKQTNSRVVWYTAPHYPHTRIGYPVVVRDWRTDSRLAIFNNFSVATARSAGFAVLDSFAISDAFAHTSPDQAHFSNFVASEFVRMLLSLLL